MAWDGREIRGRAAYTGTPLNAIEPSSVHAFTGTYGDYLLNKVDKVFPAWNEQ